MRRTFPRMKTPAEGRPFHLIKLGCGRVEMWRGGFRFEHICCRLFRLAVPHWFDHGSVSTSRSSNRTCRSSRIRLSDKISRLRPRHVVPKPVQAYEPEVPVQVREWIAPALAPPPDFVLGAQPPTQPHCRVIVERSISRADGAYLEVVRPSAQPAAGKRGYQVSQIKKIRQYNSLIGFFGSSPGSQSFLTKAASCFAPYVVGRGCNFTHHGAVSSSLLEHRAAGLAEAGLLPPQAGGNCPHIWDLACAKTIDVGGAGLFLFGRCLRS